MRVVLFPLVLFTLYVWPLLRQLRSGIIPDSFSGLETFHFFHWSVDVEN